MNFKDALHLIKKNHVNINDDMLKEALEKQTIKATGSLDNGSLDIDADSLNAYIQKRQAETDELIKRMKRKPALNWADFYKITKTGSEI